MTRYKPKMLLSLLLALVMIVTMLPMTALAAEASDEAHTCTDENCTHDHEAEAVDVYSIQDDGESEELPVSNTDETPTEETPVPEATESPEVSDEANDSGLEWDYDADCGELYIYGSGAPETFTSADDQPWAAFRESIVAVYIDDYDGLTVDSIAFWFSGCVNLEYVEIAASVREIGYHAFNNCEALQTLVLYHEDTFPSLVQGAFITNHPIDWTKGYDPRLHIAVMEEWMLDNICAYDWGADDCPVTASNGYGGATTYALTTAPSAAARAVGYCSYCKTTCAYTEAYEQWTASVHCHRLWCSNCGYDQAGGVLGEAHVFSHYNSSYDRCSYCGYLTACTCAPACTHPSYTTTWITNCQWERYCSSCGAYLGSGTTHGSTYTTWSGCNWYDYCSDCGQLMNSGVSHSYSYGSWTYYSSTRHSRTGTCTYCGATTTSYGNHSTTTKYSPYSSTQHSYGSYCSTCGSYVGSVSYASHSLSYGSWQNYSGNQHRRTVSCSTCGYSTYEYANHSLTSGSWSSISATQHRRTLSCSCGYSTTETKNHSLTYGDWTSYNGSQHKRSVSCATCGYSTTEYANHTLTEGAWSSISATQHRRTLSCSCGYSTTETVSHTLTYGSWASISDTQHQRTGTCSCGYSNTEIGAHTDANDDGYCDDCEYLMTRFSVTVPASLSLVVSKTGEVFSANNAAIVNNSTGAVEVTAVTVTTANGWSLSPYTANMANAKVDTKLIGFTLNGAATVGDGATEVLTLPGDWEITKGDSLPLVYDAVVSAMSEPVSEQVLTIVFVLDWALR